MKTNELTGAALDWAVAKCEHPDLVWGNSIGIHHASHQIVIPHLPEPQCYWSPSTNWAQGGPIIEREGIELSRDMGVYPDLPDGSLGVNLVHKWMANIERRWQYGPTPLIAAMRCYCASKLGNEVDVPKELTNELD